MIERYDADILTSLNTGIQRLHGLMLAEADEDQYRGLLRVTVAATIRRDELRHEVAKHVAPWFQVEA